MNVSRHAHSLPWLAVLAAVGTCGDAQAQLRTPVVEEPRWLKFNPTEASLGVYSEGTFEKITSVTPGMSSTHNHFFVGPSVGLTADGSIYHPYLFRYDFTGEGAYGLNQDSFQQPSGSTVQKDMQFLGRFNGNADILGNKPYNGKLHGSYDHSYRDYDFFNTVTVDTLRYGARVAYTLSPIAVSARYAHLNEDITGFDAPSSNDQDVVGFDAQHTRDHGSTSLAYTQDRYTRVDSGVLTDGNDLAASLSDTEHFGSRDQFRLHTTGAYNRQESTVQTSDQIIATADFEAKHLDNLTSLYDVSYNRYQQADYDNENLFGRAQVRHQLYESLTSTLFAQASDTEGEADGSTGYVRRYGGGLAEGYSKGLTDQHRLRIDASVLLEHVDQQALSTIKNERHDFAAPGNPSPDSFLLNQPNVLANTIVLTDTSAQQVFVAGLDYDVSQTAGNDSPQTLITRLRPPGRPPMPDVVLASYQTQSTEAGSYESLTESGQIRFDFWKNLWGIYGRLNSSLNNAAAELRILKVRTYTAGTDVRWRWLRAGAEYEIYDSDQAQYHSTRLFQTLTFRPDLVSSLAVNVSERWTDYVESGQQEQNYRFITRYHRGLTSHLAGDVEGGVDVRRGTGIDQTQAAVRLGIDYVVGKLSVKAGYDFEYDLYLGSEERTRHLFFLRAKRVF